MRHLRMLPISMCAFLLHLVVPIFETLQGAANVIVAERALHSGQQGLYSWQDPRPVWDVGNGQPIFESAPRMEQKATSPSPWGAVQQSAMMLVNDGGNPNISTATEQQVHAQKFSESFYYSCMLGKNKAQQETAPF